MPGIATTLAILTRRSVARRARLSPAPGGAAPQKFEERTVFRLESVGFLEFSAGGGEPTNETAQSAAGGAPLPSDRSVKRRLQEWHHQPPRSPTGSRSSSPQ
jgi:hypothetical protein